MKDLLGNGIFVVDGAKWLHQRKLASLQFSTKVLRDFSTVIFKSNAGKLVQNISLLSSAGKTMDLQVNNWIQINDLDIRYSFVFTCILFVFMQDLLMKSTLDTMFKVGFGFNLDTLSGLDEASNRFMKAFDDSNGLVYWRFVDLLWRVKRFFNIGSEAALKQNITIIDNFLYTLIRNKREQKKTESLIVSKLFLSFTS